VKYRKLSELANCFRI